MDSDVRTGFVDPEETVEWEPVEGRPDGVDQRLLYEAADGSHSRILRIAPGVRVDEVMQHDFHEEILLLEGGLYDERSDTVYQAGSYAYHPPGTKHGPHHFPVGATIFEARYYREE